MANRKRVRTARALLNLLDQVNQRWPRRNKRSDGRWPSLAHSIRNPRSDHEPNAVGVGRAIDITHDPKTGPDMNQLAESLRKQRHPAIKYVIWNKRMFSSYDHAGIPKFTWRKGSGHTKHMHVSTWNNPVKYDSDKRWDIPVRVPSAKPVPLGSQAKKYSAILVTAARGEESDFVRALQAAMNSRGARLVVDGDYGPKTAAALKKMGLSRDGQKVDLKDLLTFMLQSMV